MNARWMTPSATAAASCRLLTCSRGARSREGADPQKRRARPTSAPAALGSGREGLPLRHAAAAGGRVLSALPCARPGPLTAGRVGAGSAAAEVDNQGGDHRDADDGGDDV